MISCVVPVYNEADCLEQNLGVMRDFLAQQIGEPFEIVCVDDCSVDATPEILARLQQSHGLVVVRNEHNLGKGGSVARGMLLARGERVFFTDADLSTPLDELLRFMPYLDHGYDVVIGNRKNPEAVIKRYQPPHRVYMGLAYTKLVNFVMGLNVSDYTCGFKCFRGAAARSIFARSRIAGWSFDVEILYIAHQLGYKLKEVPVTWEDHPDSKVRLVRDTVRSFTELLRIRIDAWRGLYDLSADAAPVPQESRSQG
ncbi:MAG: dolichyl-phosphate beta-glucosyltransferase [Planctomycetota bacterium]